MGINIKRVFIGGLAAGAILIVSAIAMTFVVGKEMEMALARFGLPPMGYKAVVYFAITSLVTGMILVWLYAAMLPRMNRGIKNAVIAALIVWLLAYFFPNFAMVVYGFMPVRLTIIGTVWGLFELLAASLIGTRFYKE